MITLTRLSGTVFALNCDLIERVDSTPDTVVTLVDGKKYVVAESLEDVLRGVRLHRGEVLALSSSIELGHWERDVPGPRPTRLRPVSEHPTARLAAVDDAISALAGDRRHDPLRDALTDHLPGHITGHVTGHVTGHGTDPLGRHAAERNDSSEAGA